MALSKAPLLKEMLATHVSPAHLAGHLDCFETCAQDPRSWRQFARILYLLLIPFSLPVLLAGIAVTAVSGAGIFFIWGFIGVLVLLSRLGFGKADKSSGRNIDDIEAELHQTPALRNFLAQLTLLHAILVDRAGSEDFLRTKVLPDGLEVVTRQRHMALLREYGLYDRLGTVELDLMLLPDGHWREEIAYQVALALEPLRLLRWVLRADKFLPTVGETMVLDFKLASSLISNPDLVFKSKGWISMKGIDTAINSAELFFYRCWAEGVYRGLYEESSEEKKTTLRNYALRLADSESEDLLLGSVIVSRASDGDVRHAARMALRRANVLRWIRNQLLGREPEPEELCMFYRPDLEQAEND